MTIGLYAEYLLNIRAVSIQVALSTASTQATKATVSADGSTLTLAHEDESASIALPVKLPGGQSDAALKIPVAPTKSLSFRVQLQGKPDSSGFLANGLEADSNVVPWAAPSLTADTAIACRYCDAQLLQRQRVRSWKDLPSDNWAEMMDFWHCHRPHAPKEAGVDLATKGYSAGSTLAVVPGVGMIDPTDFVLAAEDCSNINTLFRTRNEAASLQCSGCGTIVGHVHSSGGFKIRKTHLALSTMIGRHFASYDASKWWACLLLSSMDCQGVRKFTAQSTSADRRLAMKLWIFTPDIYVSTSAIAAPSPFRTMKVFWRNCDFPAQDCGALNRQALAEGELEFPEHEMVQLRKTLQASARWLPEVAQRFQDWHVAILPRFTSAEVGHEQVQYALPASLLQRGSDRPHE